MNRILRSALAVAGVALATPALAWTVYPDVDFEWYANVGKSLTAPATEVTPAARNGYIWSPASWQNGDSGQTYVAAHWVKDDYQEQLALYNTGRTPMFASGPMILLDRDGNIIPTNAAAYPVDSAYR